MFSILFIGSGEVSIDQALGQVSGRRVKVVGYLVQDVFILIEDGILNILPAVIVDGMGDVLPDLVVVCFPDLVGHGDEVVMVLGIFPDGQAFDDELPVEDDVGPDFDLGGGAPVDVDLDLGNVHSYSSSSLGFLGGHR
jgi:hypothetical protein